MPLSMWMAVLDKKGTHIYSHQHEGVSWLLLSLFFVLLAEMNKYPARLKPGKPLA